MRNFLLTIRFLGTPYVGWQVQKNGISVMEKVQDAIEKVTGVRSDVKGCSRTDSGVHANMYCLSFKTESTIPTEKLPIALNRKLPDAITVMSCEEKTMDFHARYNCLGKEYLYKIHCSRFRDPFLHQLVLEYPRPLNVRAMQAACVHFEGTHDFRSFCSIRTDQEDTTRTLWWVKVEKNGEMLEVRVAGDGFLFNMVRIIIGTLLWVGSGVLSPEDVLRIRESKERDYAGMTAQAYGLYLNRVFYNFEEVKKFGEDS